MDAIIRQGTLTGQIPAISSKSMAHRLLILAALAPAPTELACNTTSEDIDATVRCLEALGARVERVEGGFHVTPLPGRPDDDNVPDALAGASLDCGESGSTLRFMLPVLGALGKGGALTGHGRLAQRPLSPLYEQLQAHGLTMSAQGSFPLAVGGRLQPGRFVLPGDVSSQYVTGLLLAAPLLASPTEILVSEPVQSRPYIKLTVNALKAFGVPVLTSRESVGGRAVSVYTVSPTRLVSPGSCTVEGDWSNAAFWLAAGAAAPLGVTVTGLDLASSQGDRSAMAALAAFGARIARRGHAVRATRDHPRPTSLDVSNFPDLVPPLAATAAMIPGTSALTNAGRLRLKESDRVETVSACLTAFGVPVRIEGDDIVIEGRGTLRAAEVDAANDHRIAMMAAVLASQAPGESVIHDAGCVAKSYPTFWEDFARLGGHVETREG